MNSGDYLWRIPLGEYPDLVAQGLLSTGSENYGGPILTAGSLVIMGDNDFRPETENVRQRQRTPALVHKITICGRGDTITYAIDGRQYIVIATDNSRNPKAPQGSAYVAYALGGALQSDCIAQQ